MTKLPSSDENINAKIIFIASFAILLEILMIYFVFSETFYYLTEICNDESPCCQSVSTYCYTYSIIYLQIPNIMDNVIFGIEQRINYI